MNVAVVGAGPAGAWAAYQLARRGARVTIFDHSHPREKPCGGGITGRALALVAGARDGSRLGVDALRPIRSARFTDSLGNTRAVVPLKAGGLAVASRATFDAALLEAAVRAGAVHTTARVVDVTVGSSVRVHTRRAISSGGVHSGGPRRQDFSGGPSSPEDFDFLVGADGANSIVRRRVGERFTREQLSIATGFFARGITSDEIVIEMVRRPPGYIWSFPRPDHLAIGVCAQADAGVGAGALLARTAEWTRAAHVADGATLIPYSWPIPTLSPRDLSSQKIAGPRWCLVGDAAGLVDPITREGIFFALASAEWAAEALADGRAVAADYLARVRRDAVPELSAAARLKAGFFRPAFTRLMLDGLTRSEAIRSTMADLVAGTQSYRSLKWRLLRSLELGVARAFLSQRAT
jgi:geranylgeranyl reductase family protein